jgi:hypothetical protein
MVVFGLDNKLKAFLFPQTDPLWDNSSVSFFGVYVIFKVSAKCLGPELLFPVHSTCQNVVSSLEQASKYLSLQVVFNNIFIHFFVLAFLCSNVWSFFVSVVHRA